MSSPPLKSSGTERGNFIGYTWDEQAGALILLHWQGVQSDYSKGNVIAFDSRILLRLCPWNVPRRALRRSLPLLAIVAPLLAVAYDGQPLRLRFAFLFCGRLADKVRIAVIIGSVFVAHGFQVQVNLAVLVRFGAAFGKSNDNAVLALDCGADNALELQDIN